MGRKTPKINAPPSAKNNLRVKAGYYRAVGMSECRNVGKIRHSDRLCWVLSSVGKSETWHSDKNEKKRESDLPFPTWSKSQKVGNPTFRLSDNCWVLSSGQASDCRKFQILCRFMKQPNYFKKLHHRITNKNFQILCRFLKNQNN